MRILLLSTLFPNAPDPNHGIFVENRMQAYRRKYDADIRVCAPTPWFPLSDAAPMVKYAPLARQTLRRYGRYGRAPLRETRRGVAVTHPRYGIAPGLAMSMAPRALARCLRRELQHLIDAGWRPDLIDAHYLYPDGVAAIRAAKEFGVPVVLTARGSDVTQLPTYRGPRRAIMNAVADADAVIAVADALRMRLEALGAPEGKVAVLRNGVDLEMFRPVDRTAARARFGLNGGPVVASVGQLIARKGHDIVIDAVAAIPDATLLISGQGADEHRLRRRAVRKGLGARTHFLGAVDHSAMREVYNAADVLALASSREGWPNVLLEAMACGAPCVVADAGGCAEVVSAPRAGVVVKERTPAAFSSALSAALAQPGRRDAARAHAEAHSWDATVDALHGVFTDVAERARRRRAFAAAPVALAAERTPRLLITVDTEEIFDWRRFDGPRRVAPPGDVDRFQRLCATAGAAPLYFLSHALVTDPTAAQYFRALAQTGAAALGMHTHAWTTNAGAPYQDDYHSYQKNLPLDVHRRVLREQCAAFADAFGVAALAHRAGRYGVGPELYADLAAIGVTHDFSPSPGFNDARRGGPDFTQCSNAPFVAGAEHGDVYVTPVSGARALRHTRYFLPQTMSRAGFAPPRARAAAAAGAAPVRLSPEGADLATLKSLTRRLLRDGAPVLTFTLHSTSLTKGANPYAQSEDDVARILTISADYLAWFRQDLGGEVISFDALKALYAAAPLTRL